MPQDKKLLKDFEASLEAQVKSASGVLTIDGALLGRSDFAPLVASALGRSEGNLIVVAPSWAVTWFDGGFRVDVQLPTEREEAVLGLTSHAATLSFLIQQGLIDVDLEIDVENSALVEALPSLRGTVVQILDLTTPSLVFSTRSGSAEGVPDFSWPAGLSLRAGVADSNPLAVARGLLNPGGDSSPVQFAGSVQIRSNGTLVDLRAPLGTTALDIGLFSIQNPYLGIAILPLGGSSGNTSGDAQDPASTQGLQTTLEKAYVGATVAVKDASGTEIDIDVEAYVPYSGSINYLSLFLRPANDIQTTLANLGALIGGASWSSFFTGPAKPLEPLLDEFALKGMSVDVGLPGLKPSSIYVYAGTVRPWKTFDDQLQLNGFNVGWLILSPLGQRTMTATLDAEIQLFDDPNLTFNAEVTVPDLTFSASLAADHSFGLAELWNQAASAFGLPTIPASSAPNVKLSKLSLYAQPSQKTLSIMGEVETGLTISVGPASIALEDFSGSVAYDGNAQDKLSGTLSATISIAATAFVFSAARSPSGDWTFYGALNEGATMDLAAIVDEILPAGVDLPDSLSDMKVGGVSVSWQSSSSASEFDFTAATASPWRLQLASKSVSFQASVQIHSGDQANAGAGDSGAGPTSRVTTGTIEGQLTVGDLQFNASFELKASEKILKASWKSDSDPLRLEDLATAFGLTAPDTSELDLSITGVSFELDLEQGGTETLTLNVATSLGDAFVELLHTDGSWGLVFGLALPSTFEHLSSIGGKVGSALKVFDFIEIESAFVLAASKDFAAVALPAIPAFSTTPAKVSEGLVLGAGIDLATNASKTPSMHNLKTLTGQTSLVLLAQLGTDDISLEAALGGSIVVMDAFTLSDPQVILRASPLAITLVGSVDFTLGGNQYDATGLLTIDDQEALADFEIKAETGTLPVPLVFPGLHLTEIAFQIGVEFEPPSLLLGLEGKFTIGPKSSQPTKPTMPTRSLTLPAGSRQALPGTNEFTLIFGVDPDVINPVLISFFLQTISLSEILEACTDKPEDLGPIFDDIHATDVMFYWCEGPQPVLQPDGTMAPPGFGFNGNLDILGFHSHAGLQIANNKINGDASMDPIDLPGVLSVTGDGAGTPAGYTGSIQIKPGGPVLHVSTLASPYLHASWSIVLFESLHQSVDVTVDTGGFSFEISEGLSSLFDAALSCTLNGSTSFEAGFSVLLNLKLGPIKILHVDLGTIDLVNIGCGANLAIEFEPEFSLKVDGSFEFDGHAIDVSIGPLTIAPTSVEDLPKFIIDELEKDPGKFFKWLADEAEAILRDGLKALDGLEKDLAEDLEKLDLDLKNDLASVEREISGAVKAAEKLFDNQVAAVERDAEELLRGTKQLVHDLEATAQKVLDDARQVLDEVEHEAERVGSTVSHDIANGADDVKHGLEDAGHTIAGWF